MNVEIARLPGVVLDGREDGWTYAVEVPDIVRQTLQVTHVSTGIERYGDQRIGVQVVAGTHAAIEVRRRIADGEIDAVVNC